MSNTGSMFIGLLISYQIILLLSSQHISGLQFKVSTMSIVVLCLTTYPIFNSLKVFIIRIKVEKVRLVPTEIIDIIN